jgi:hypothetical protein
MYEVIKVDGGWQVAWVESPGTLPRPVRVKPYKQRQGAYRKRKQLNDALQDVDQMIAKDGAIIV